MEYYVVRSYHPVHDYNSGTRDIAVQLNLTLAMDRCDIASSCIFVESRKTELRVSDIALSLWKVEH